jgi:phenylpyruvate tautomerase PptA (4-oxalocrotonate tautomerase family)
MPITVTATEGVLDPHAQAHILPRLSKALLERHGLNDNAFMVPAVVGSVHILPPGRTFTGGRAERAIFVELKVPSVTFQTVEQKQGFLDDVNAILDELTNGTYPRDKTFFNITYAVDGSWGIGAKAYTNEELGAAIAAAAPIAVR